MVDARTTLTYRASEAHIGERQFRKLEGACAIRVTGSILSGCRIKTPKSKENIKTNGCNEGGKLGLTKMVRALCVLLGMIWR